MTSWGGDAAGREDACCNRYGDDRLLPAIVIAYSFPEGFSWIGWLANRETSLSNILSTFWRVRKALSRYNSNLSANHAKILCRDSGAWHSARMRSSPRYYLPHPERSSNESDAEYRDSGGSRWGRILLPITLVVAIAAAALSGWLLTREGTSKSPNYSDAQRTEAKQKICAAMDVVRKGVSLNTNLQPPGGPEDVTGALAVAANARVALYDGGQYLLARLDPATPAELADAVKKFGNLLMDIGAGRHRGAAEFRARTGGALKRSGRSQHDRHELVQITTNPVSNDF